MTWGVRSFVKGVRVTGPGLSIAAFGVVALTFGFYDLLVGATSYLNVILVLIGRFFLSLFVKASKKTQTNVVIASMSLLLTFTSIEWALRSVDVYERIAGEYNPGLSRSFHHNYGAHECFIRYPSALDEFPPTLNEINSLGIRDK